MRTTRILTVLCLTAASMVGCAKEQPAPEASTPPPPPKPMQAERATLTEGFSTPESVFYDADQDVYFVSNINGSPLVEDGNGFISKVNAESREITAKWIDGETEGVTLNAPKGLTITGETLWVTDINVVRKFDRTTGAPLGEVAIEGSVFLNALSPSEDGSVFVSDTGLKVGTEGFEPSGTDAIYRIAPDGALEKLIDGDELLRPNGVVWTPEGLWSVTFGSNQLFMVANGEKTNVVELPSGSLDGLLALEGGDVLLSSWDSQSVYRGPVAGPFEVVVENVNTPADIGFDSKRQLILVPQFGDSIVVLHPLK